MFLNEVRAVIAIGSIPTILNLLYDQTKTEPMLNLTKNKAVAKTIISTTNKLA